MNKNSKAPAEGGVARASQYHLHMNSNKRPPITQPGTALVAFLKRYKSDLLLLPCNNHISRLVDATDIILDEVGGC